MYVCFKFTVASECLSMDVYGNLFVRVVVDSGLTQTQKLLIIIIIIISIMIVLGLLLLVS